MSYNILRVCKWRLAVVALFVLGGQFALASNAPVVSGSYEVVQSTDLGSQTQIRMLIHLTNHGPYDLSIQRMTLWDFSHPDKGGIPSLCGLASRARVHRDHTGIHHPAVGLSVVAKGNASPTRPADAGAW
jgi:hypothetical protein